MTVANRIINTYTNLFAGLSVIVEFYEQNSKLP